MAKGVQPSGEREKVKKIKTSSNGLEFLLLNPGRFLVLEAQQESKNENGSDNYFKFMRLIFQNSWVMKPDSNDPVNIEELFENGDYDDDIREVVEQFLTFCRVIKQTGVPKVDSKSTA